VYCCISCVYLYSWYRFIPVTCYHDHSMTDFFILPDAILYYVFVFALQLTKTVANILSLKQFQNTSAVDFSLWLCLIYNYIEILFLLVLLRDTGFFLLREKRISSVIWIFCLLIALYFSEIFSRYFRDDEVIQRRDKRSVFTVVLSTYPWIISIISHTIAYGCCRHDRKVWKAERRLTVIVFAQFSPFPASAFHF